MNKLLALLLTLVYATGSFAQSSNACKDVPVLNKKIVAFVKNTIGKRVGKGECWDLAAEALNACSAKWDGNYEFGKKINPAEECVYGGDVIQFENIELVYEKNKAFYRESMAHHTAVIISVKSKNKFIIADQNTRFSGKKVGSRELDLSTITKGTYTIYRPQS